MTLTTGFTTTALAGDRVLVQGTDFQGTTNKTVLSSREFNDIVRERDHLALHEEFDASVKAFYAPITAAAEALEKAHEVVIDPLFFIVEQEGTDGVASKSEVIRHLQHDTVVLRLIEQDPATTRLVWVGEDLEILAAQPAAVQSTPVFDELATGSN